MWTQCMQCWRSVARPGSVCDQLMVRYMRERQSRLCWQFRPNCFALIISYIWRTVQRLEQSGLRRCTQVFSCWGARFQAFSVPMLSEWKLQSLAVSQSGLVFMCSSGSKRCANTTQLIDSALTLKSGLRDTGIAFGVKALSVERLKLWIEKRSAF